MGPIRYERYNDKQFKILIREAPELVLKHWEVLRRNQPRIHKLVVQVAAERPVFRRPD